MTAVPPLPVAPVLAVDGAEIAFLVGPFVPDADLLLLQPGDVGVAAQEPEQFDDDRTQMELLGPDQKEAFGEIEPHLVAEDREGARAGPVLLWNARVEDAAEELLVGLHDLSMAGAAGLWK